MAAGFGFRRQSDVHGLYRLDGPLYDQPHNERRELQLFPAGEPRLLVYGSDLLTGQFTSPSGLGLNGPNFLLVADFGNTRVQKFQTNGTYLARFGTNGIESGQLRGPTDVAIDPSGDVWVTDGPTGRLVEFGPTGNGLQVFGGDVAITAVPGSPPLNVDPVFDPRALLVFPGNSLSSTITLTSLGYTGYMVETASCCLDQATSLPTNPGVSVGPTQQSLYVAPQQPATEVLSLTASSPPAPGKFVAQVKAQDLTNTFSHEVGVGFEVLPPWPGDGPVPACMPGLQVLKLSKLDLFKLRQSMTTAPTSFSFGTFFPSTDPRCMPSGCAGIQIDVMGSAGQVPPDRATVFVSNPSDGDVSVTTSDSRSCSRTQTVLIRAHGGQWLNFTKADTTTLVFNDANGSPSIAKAQFSEGPFWAFFGGRMTTITVVGNFHSPN
jgi:hypothetical protein